MWMVDEVIARRPAGPLGKPLEQWTHAELLMDAARHGLMRIREFVTKRPITAESDWKEDRALAEMALQAAKLYAHVQVSQLRHAEEQVDWAAYMKELQRERRVLDIGPESEAPEVKRAKKGSSQARK
jgi:hypothetical protein